MASNTIRAVYRSAPVPIAVKLRIKDLIFTSLPLLSRHTVAYRAWQVHVRTRAAQLLDPPVAPPAFTANATDALPAWFYDDDSGDYVGQPRTQAVETRVRLIAFYLPQFHPIPENDRWWGKGFTEWTNVSRAKPQFPGHYQPHLPGELGFYDLRSIDIQRRQIELAKLHGLAGFCYYHYWFAGTRLLRQPLDHLLANPSLDFPFCLCWANENWTRRWDGKEDEVLIAQRHSAEDDLAFIRDIEPALRDPRYIRVDGRLLLLVYHPALLPDARATTDRWRQYCRRAGLGELFLMMTHAFDRHDPRLLGFDAALEFAPNNMGASPITADVPHLHPNFRGHIYDYRFLVEHSRHYAAMDYPLFRSVAPMWDNEARRPGRGGLFVHSSPGRYREWLSNACRYTLDHLPPQTPLVFVNAWNEWAEGAHLEPDRRHGYAYLAATAEALQAFPPVRRRQDDTSPRPRIVCVSHDAHFHGAQLVALNLARTLREQLRYDVDIILCGDGVLRAEFEEIGRVHDFCSPSVTQTQREDVVRKLRADGVRVAICNTSVVGDTVALLKQHGFTVVSLVHELPGFIKERGLEQSSTLIAQHADRIVFPADIVRQRFVEQTGLDERKAIVRPQGLFAPNAFAGRRDEARRMLRARLGLDEQTRVILAMGYADTRKGLDLFVDTGLRCDREDLAFVWVGHYDPALLALVQARIEACGAGDRFRFHGLVRESDLFFAGADAYLMTSREDPFPMVVLHALDAELPVIGFEDAGGFDELLRRDCGLLVPHGDTDAMACALSRLLDDPVERRRLGRTGHAIVSRELAFVEYARHLVRLAETDRPTVSVVVPNYNYARYLPGRLRSIFDQTCAPTEILFLDDASQDDSVAVAERLLRECGIPYRIIVNESNEGCFRQWLRGIQAATGDLVWIAEADDECEPEFLETLVDAMRSEGVVLAYCQSRQIDETGRDIAPDYGEYTRDISETKWQRSYVRRGVDEIRDTLIVKNTIPNVSAVLMRKPDLSAIAARLVELEHAGDWLVYVHLLERGDLAFVSRTLNAHRRHSRGVTLAGSSVRLMREILAVQQHTLERHDIAADVDAKRLANLQATYRYLRLDEGGPPTFKDHVALKELWASRSAAEV